MEIIAPKRYVSLSSARASPRARTMLSARQPPPPLYRAPRLPPQSKGLIIDGNLEKPEWSAAPWSLPFADIRGPDFEEQPPEECATRMKMLWDENYLYVGAVVKCSFETIASFTERNSPIYQKDSDFEVFIDADYSCHQYKEFEVNPNNVVWNLMLTQPYADGGEECSGRVATPKENDRYYEVAKQRSATRLLSGAIGDPNGATWAVEVAFAHSDTLARCAFPSRAIQPTVGNRWRVNFSRVERCGEINWTWAPQIIWEPRSKCYEGKVNMHLPDAWGAVEFAPCAGRGGPPPKPLGQDGGAEDAAAMAAEPVSIAADAAMNGYYALKAYAEVNGKLPKTVDELKAAELLDEVLIAKCSGFEILVDEDIAPKVFVVQAIVGEGDGATSATVTEDRLLCITDPNAIHNGGMLEDP